MGSSEFSYEIALRSVDCAVPSESRQRDSRFYEMWPPTAREGLQGAMAIARPSCLYRRQKQWLATGALLSTVLSTTAAAGQPGGDFRLGAQGVMYSYLESTVTTEAEGLDLEPVVSEFTTVGLFSPALGLVADFRLGPQIMLGGSVTFEQTTGEMVGVTVTNTTTGIYPHLRVIFGEGTVQPYIQGVLGYSTTSSSTEYDPPDALPGQITPVPLEDVDASASGMGFGGAVGAHLFLTDAISLDPALHVRQAYHTVDDTGDADVSMDATQIMLTLTLSAWMGGVRSTDDVAEMQAEVANHQTIITEGTYSVEFGLVDGPIVRLSGEPGKSPLVAIDIAQPGGTTEVCRELAIIAARKIHHISAEVRFGRRAGNPAALVHATNSVDHLGRLAETAGEIRFCGKQYSLEYEGQDALADFVEKYRVGIKIGRVAEVLRRKQAAERRAAERALDRAESSPMPELAPNMDGLVPQPEAVDVPPEGAVTRPVPSLPRLLSHPSLTEPRP